MAEKIKDQFIAGHTVKCMLSELINHFWVDECSAYVRKAENGKWELFGLCSKAYTTINEYDDEQYTFCAKLAPTISNAIFWNIYEHKDTPLNSSNYKEYFCYHNGFYFFPIDGFDIRRRESKFECSFHSYVGISFEIDEDCEVEMTRIPFSEYEEIDFNFPYDNAE